MININLLINLIIFLLFILLQSLFINGLHYCFKFNIERNPDGSIKKINGNILFPISYWIGNKKGKFWDFISKPIFECVRCMSSVYGTLSFWVFYLLAYDFYWQLFLLWLFDIVILVCLNWLIYKKQ